MTSKYTVRPIPTSNDRWSDKLGIRGIAVDDPVKISVVPSGQPSISVVSSAHMNMMTFRRPACPIPPATGHFVALGRRIGLAVTKARVDNWLFRHHQTGVNPWPVETHRV
jgi:hypothetical protein